MSRPSVRQSVHMAMLSRNVISRIFRCREPFVQVRCYSRGFSRRPVRVLSVDEAYDLARGRDQVVEPAVPRVPGWSGQVGRGDDGRLVEEKGVRFMLPSHLRYEKLEEGDKRFGPVVMAAKSRKLREKTKTILLEGKRLISDAVKAGIRIKSLYFTWVEVLEGLPLEELNSTTEMYKVFPGHMKIWTDMTTMPGLMAICERPGPEHVIQDPQHTVPITLVCDNVRDPGNMGALLRTAAAVGCRRVLATKGCVDVWEPKVLRAAAGVHFQTRIVNNLGWEMVGNYLAPDSDIYLADNHGEVKAFKGKARKQAIKKILEITSEKYSEVNEETGESVDIDTGYLDKETMEMYKVMPLSVRNYSDVDFGQREVVLVVGGETEGLSAAAHKLAFDNSGEKIYVPMVPQVESLNAAIAGSVILFEIKRQIVNVQTLHQNNLKPAEDSDRNATSSS